MNRLTPPMIRRFVPIVKTAIAIAVVIGLFVATRSAIGQWHEQTRQIQQDLESLEQRIAAADDTQRAALERERSVLHASVPRFENVRWRGVFIAGCLYACGLVPSAFVLHRSLAAMGTSPRVSTCVAGQLIGHVGKYVPGKAMVIVLRAGALARDGIAPMTATICVFVETFFMMAVGAAISGAIIYRMPVPDWMTWTAAMVAIAATIPTLPPVLRRVVARFTVAKSTEPTDNHPKSDFLADGWAQFFFIGWGCSMLSWGLIGASFAALVWSIPSATEAPPTFTLLAVSTASMALAIVVGFASLLPGGAGIRELVLTTVMAVSVGSTVAILSAVAARLLYIAVEALLAFVAWLWLKRFQRGVDQRSQASDSSLHLVSG